MNMERENNVKNINLLLSCLSVTLLSTSLLNCSPPEAGDEIVLMLSKNFRFHKLSHACACAPPPPHTHTY